MKYTTLLLVVMSIKMFSQTTPGEYTVKNVEINTKFSDFGTAFFGKDKVVFASPKEGVVITKSVWDYNKQPFLDIFIAEVSKDGEILNKKKVPGDINTKYHEAAVSFTKDMKTVYFSANSYVKKKYRTDSTGTNNIQMFKASVNEKGEWTNARLLPFNGLEFSSGHPTLNKDDTKLYFASDRPGSIGKTDIYVVDVNSDGTYSEPKNLGPKINTEEREMFPFISDNDILYFSSNGHQGHGELDVFASRIFDTTVSDPINLEEPVNSKRDDFAYIIDDVIHKGYFSSNRKGGKGDDDIYMFTASPPLYIEGKQVIAGIIKGKKTQELLLGATVTLLDEKGNEIKTVTVNEEDGSFSFDAISDKEYKIVVNAPGYLKEEIDIKTVNDIDVDPLEVNVNMAQELRVVEEKIMININTIYFDFDKWNIRPDAAKELDKVIAVMKEHPSMVIEGGSHTDSRAKERYNQILSEKRAQATVDYIVAGGIDVSRLTSKGYGEKQLVNNCSSFVKCSREKHQLNRRTEFVIVNDNDRFTSVAATISDVVIGRDNMTKVRLNNKQEIQQDQNISLRKQSFYIIAGSFRKYTNAVTKVNQLKALGYKAKILERNQKGLRQVSYDSYNNKGDALYNLSIIRKNHDKEAWILIKELDEPVNDIKTQEKIVKKIEQTVSSNRNYIKIEPIYFGFDKWSLSNTELYELDKVVQIMKNNPTIIVEAGAHTDSKNLETYNQLLSEKRAKTVVKYIISKGINQNRITGKGYGEKQYVNRCRSFVKCTAAEQQANRRIEFVIVDGNVYPETETIQKSNGEKYLNHNPIYFNFDKYDIRKDALYELKRIVRIMNENPDMKIIAESHTDSQNRESYNQILSEKRAKTIKNYIISQGINVNRVISRGFGETQLINHCKSFVKCTSKEHQENRRTEFKIVKM